MRQVRWVLQASKPGHDNWVEQGDRVYSGWFYSTGNDEPSATVLAEYDKAVQELDWLDVRLVQELKSYSKTVIKEHYREVAND